jgi:hypothetical protein
MTGKNEFTLIGASLVDVSDSRSLNNVSDDKLLYRLVLRDATSAVGAVDIYDMSSAVLGSSSVSSLLSLLSAESKKRET